MSLPTCLSTVRCASKPNRFELPPYLGSVDEEFSPCLPILDLDFSCQSPDIHDSFALFFESAAGQHIGGSREPHFIQFVRCVLLDMNLFLDCRKSIHIIIF